MARKKENKSIEFSNQVADDVSDSSLVVDINQKYAWYLQESRITRRQWLINAAFTRGHQFSVLHRTEDRIIEIKEPTNRKMVQVDKISPWKRHMIANIIIGVPMFQAQPEDSLTPDSVSAARVGTALLRHYWETWDFDIQKIVAAGHLVDFGNAFIFVNYEEDGTKFISQPVTDVMTGEQVVDDVGEPVTTQKAIGDITTTVLSPQQVVFSMDGLPIEDKPWIMIVNKRELSYFKNTYPEHGNEVMPETYMNVSNYDLRLLSDNLNKQVAGKIKYATEKIYLQKPCKNNPDGCIAIVGGDVLLQRSTWGFKKLTDYPIIHLHFPKEAEEPFARSMVEPQIPIQRAINIISSILEENIDEMAHLKWLVANQGDIDEITDDNGIIRYNYPFKPEQSALQPMPNYPMEFLNYLESALQDIQSYHSVSKGGSESGVRSDSHAQNLQDQDMQPLSVLDEILRVGYERLGEIVLAIAAEKLTDERTISYIGEDKRRIITKFKASMLGNTQTVKVRLDNTYLRNKAAVVSNILQIAQMGLITDSYGQPDGNKVLRMMEFGLPDSIFSEMQLHTELAYHENDIMMGGKQAIITQWQNHKIHLDIHEEFMNSVEFMKLYDDTNNKNNQMLISLFSQHITQHSQIMMQNMGMLQPKQPPQNNNNRASQGAENKPAQAQSPQQ